MHRFQRAGLAKVALIGTRRPRSRLACFERLSLVCVRIRLRARSGPLWVCIHTSTLEAMRTQGAINSSFHRACTLEAMRTQVAFPETSIIIYPRRHLTLSTVMVSLHLFSFSRNLRITALSNQPDDGATDITSSRIPSCAKSRQTISFFGGGMMLARTPQPSIFTAFAQIGASDFARL
jgi:hypothetical protein